MKDSAVDAKERMDDKAEALSKAWWLALQSKPDTVLYVVVDPAVRSALDDEDFQQALVRARVPVAPILWHHPQLRADHRPLLIPLDLSNNLGSELLCLSLRMCARDSQGESLQQGLGQRIAGWLLSDAPLSTLRVHLGQTTVQTLPVEYRAHLGQTRLLRHFDPLVMSILWPLSDDKQCAVLLGPIDQWHWLENQGEDSLLMRCALRSEQHPTAGDRRPNQIPWSLSQWQTLQALDALNPALIARGLQAKDLAQRDTLLATLRRLLVCGITAPRTLERMAELALTRHPEFDRHPTVQALIARQQPSTFAATLSHLKEDDWQRVCAELNTRA